MRGAARAVWIALAIGACDDGGGGPDADDRGGRAGDAAAADAHAGHGDAAPPGDAAPGPAADGAVDSGGTTPDAGDPGAVDAAVAPVPPRVGGACTAETTCPAGGSGEPRCLLDWPGGYCVVVGCSDHGHDCPDDPGQDGATTGSKCVLSPGPTCLALCGRDEDCREGYVCGSRGDPAGHGSARVCVPGP